MLTPDELATQLILDRARDVKWLTIGERLMDDGLSGPDAVVAAQRIAELIATATITVELPGTPERQAPPASGGALRDRVADAILAHLYPDGAAGEGEMDTAREEADAVMAVITPELERLRDEVDRRIAEQGIDLRSAERDSLARRLNIRYGELSQARADAQRWHDTYQSEVTTRDAFLGHLLELLPGAEDTGMDAYDQIPRGIKTLRAERDELKADLERVRADRDALRQQLETESDVSHGLWLELKQRREDLAELRAALEAAEFARQAAEVRGLLDQVGAIYNACPNTPDEHGCPWCRIAELEAAEQRVREVCDDAAPHPDHDHVCPDDILRALDGGEVQ